MAEPQKNSFDLLRLLAAVLVASVLAYVSRHLLEKRALVFKPKRKVLV
jgi:hypothetical protein